MEEYFGHFVGRVSNPNGGKKYLSFSFDFFAFKLSLV
jgi:hypothetical protein